MGKELLIPSSMLRHENDMFLDSVTVEDLEKELDVKVIAVDNDGCQFVEKVLGGKVQW